MLQRIRHMAERRARAGMRPGFIMISVIGALLIMALIAPPLYRTWQDKKESWRNVAVARQFQAVSKAAEKYIKKNHASLIEASTETNGPEITISDLHSGNYLPDSIDEPNPWNQRYYISTRVTPGTGTDDDGNPVDDLVGVIVTVDGRGPDTHDRKFANVTVPETAAMASAGFVPVEDPNVIRGPSGTWEVTLSEMGLQRARPGHLALVTTFDSQDLDQDFMYRYEVPGHEDLNAMRTNLNMNHFDINNTRSLQFDGRKAEAVANGGFCTTEEDLGRTFLDPAQGLFVCRRDGSDNGELIMAAISDSANSMAMKNATIVENESIIDKPTCPMPNESHNGRKGTKTHPELYIVPTIMAPAETMDAAQRLKAIHAFQSWASNHPDPNDSGSPQWKVHLRVLTSEDKWVKPTGIYGQLMVFTACVKD